MGVVSPALPHGESQVPRNKCRASNSRTFEAKCMQKQQGSTPQNRLSAQQYHVHQIYQHAAVTNQKKGVLDKRNKGKTLTHQYSDDSTNKSEQRVYRFSHFLSNRETTKVA